MWPLVESAAMREADRLASAEQGDDVLLQRAGVAVAHEARRLLGHLYGRRVAVVAGPGHNGEDGRRATAWLLDRGVRVELVETAFQPPHLRGYDLVIDAAFGLGCSRPYEFPLVDSATPVLSVDLPSGVRADDGAVLGQPPRATVTLALGALKAAHVTGPGVEYLGDVRLATLAIPVSSGSGLVVDDDLTPWMHPVADHKWSCAVSVLAGSASMPGAAQLVCAGAIAGGASLVHLHERGDAPRPFGLAPEVVSRYGLRRDERTRAAVVGPGLGAGASWLAPFLATCDVPTVLDADALQPSVLREVAGRADVVLTPHEGEFARIAGAPSGDNRLAAVRAFAARQGNVVLLKGPRTLVAEPTGRVRVITSGTSALATAGSGDVLAGLIGALLARGLTALDAAAVAAYWHGRAGARLRPFEGSSGLAAALAEVARQLHR